MVSGFDAKADGIAIYSRKLCDFLQMAGIQVNRLNVSKDQKPPLPMEKGIVHIQWGIQFFRGRLGGAIIPYIARLRLSGSRVVVTVHDIPIAAQPKRSLAAFRYHSQKVGLLRFLGRLGKLIVYMVRVRLLLLMLTLLANVTVTHTKACRRALLGRAVVIFHGSDLVRGRFDVAPTTSPLLVTFGVIHRSRRVDVIMREYSDLPLNYVIAGASKDPDFVRFLAHHKPQNADIVITHPPLDRIIGASWAVVIPPSIEKPEHASGVIHVASSFGRPILSPPAGEAVEFREFFLIYNSAESLRSKTLELVTNVDLRRDYSNRAMMFAAKTSFLLSAEMHSRLYSALAF